MTRTVIIRPQTNDHVSSRSDQFSTRFFPSSFLHPSFLPFFLVFSFFSLRPDRSFRSCPVEELDKIPRARGRKYTSMGHDPPIFGWFPSPPTPILLACFAHKEIPSSIKDPRLNEPRCFTSFAVPPLFPRFSHRSKIKTIFHNLPFGWLVN